MIFVILGSRRWPLVRPQAGRPPASGPADRRPPGAFRHPQAAAGFPNRHRQGCVGEGWYRREVEGEQLGQEKGAGRAPEGPDRFRPVQGHAPQEAATIRAAQGPRQGPGLRISACVMKCPSRVRH